MNLFDLFHHPAKPPITNRHLAEFLLHLERRIMTQLSDLQSAVAAEDQVIASAVTLINGIADRIAAAGTDGDALAALTADVRSQSNALASAVASNTPAASAPAPAPVSADPSKPADPTASSV